MKHAQILLALLLFNVNMAQGQYVGLMKGTINGALVKYKDGTTVTVTAGYGETNRKYWEVPTYQDVDLSGVLSTSAEFIYIYVDDSESAYPSPTIVGSTDEPVWSDEKFGWYRTTTGNEDDRCIGVVWSPSGSATVQEFKAYTDLSYVVDGTTGPLAYPLQGGTPTGDFEFLAASDYTPVNAVGVYAQINNIDSGDDVIVILVPYDNGNQMLVNTSYDSHAHARGWLQFERSASRDLQWYGDSDDNNQVNIRIFGYRIDR